MTTQPTGSSPFDKFDQLKDQARTLINEGKKVLYDKKEQKIKGTFGSSFVVWLKSLSTKYEKVGTKLADLLFKEIDQIRKEYKQSIKTPLDLSAEKLKDIKTSLESGKRKAGELKTDQTFARSVSNRKLEAVQELENDVTTLIQQRNAFDESELKWKGFMDKLDAQPIEDGLIHSINIRVIQDLKKIEEKGFGPFADKDYCEKKLEAFGNALKAKIADLDKRVDPQDPDFHSTSKDLSSIQESIEVLELHALGLNELLSDRGLQIELPDFKFVEMKIAALKAKQTAFNNYQTDWEGVLLAPGANHQHYKDFIGKHGNSDFFPFGAPDDIANKKVEYAAKALDEGLKNLEAAAKIVDFLIDPAKHKETNLINSTQRRDYQEALEERNFDGAVKMASPHLQKAKELISIPDFLSVEDQAKLREAGAKLREKLNAWQYNMDDRIQQELLKVKGRLDELRLQRQELELETKGIETENKGLREQLDAKLKFAAGAMDEMKLREERLLDTLPVWPLDRESAFGNRCEQVSNDVNKMTLDELTKFEKDLEGALLALVQQSKTNESRIAKLQAKLGGQPLQETVESISQILEKSLLDGDVKAKLSKAASKQSVKIDRNSNQRQEVEKDIASYATLQALIHSKEDAATIKKFLDENDLSEFAGYVDLDEYEVLEGQLKILTESAHTELRRLEDREKETELQEKINESTIPTERLALRAELAALRGEDAKALQMAAAFADGSLQRKNEVLQTLLSAMGRLDMTRVGERGSNITELELGQALLAKVPELKKPENKRKPLTANEREILGATLEARRLIPLRDEAYQLVEAAKTECTRRADANASQLEENERVFNQAQEELQKAKEALEAYAPILDYVIAVKAQREAHNAELKVRDEVNRNTGVIRGEKEQALKAIEDEVLQHQAKQGNLILLRQSLPK